MPLYFCSTTMEVEINPTNYKCFIDRIFALPTRQEFIRVLEHVLRMNYSLWFTELGDIYLKNYGPDCSLPPYKPEREKNHTYVVVIYNRYE